MADEPADDPLATVNLPPPAATADEDDAGLDTVNYVPPAVAAARASSAAGQAAPSPAPGDVGYSSTPVLQGASTPWVDEPVGQLFGPYLLVDELGRGASGVVHRAFHRGLRRECALKTLPGKIDGVTADRFIREGLVLAKLGAHPHIVQVFDAGVVDETPYLAMELVGGHELADILRERERLPPDEVTRIGRQLAIALDYAHRQDVVHRDIKPGNIMIDARGEARLLDFGLAKDLTESAQLSAADELLGTPAYMAPEQALLGAHRIDNRTDIYGLGATLYHAAAGKLPFQAKTIAQVLTLVVTSDPPRFDPALGIPVELEAVILRAMEKDPRHRYQTALAMADDLSRLIAGERTRTRPQNATQRLLRRVQRRPGVAVLATLIVTFCVAAVATFLLSRGEAGSLWKSLSERIARATADEVRAVLEPAVPQVEEMRMLAERGLLPVDDLAALGQQLAVRLRARERLSWVSYGDRDGRYVGASRQDGALRLQRSWVREDGGVTMREDRVAPDGALTILRRGGPDWSYDPRKRPFYTAASAADGPVWTAPYAWWEGEGMGITMAVAERPGGGALRGVFTVDLHLNTLSAFLANLDVGSRGQAFLLSRDGTVLVGPDRADAGREHPLVRAALAELGGAPTSLAVGETAALRFSVDGVEYLGALQPFQVRGGLEWVTAAFVPVTDLVGSLEGAAAVSGGVGLLLLIALGLHTLLWGLRRRRELARAMADAEARQTRLGG